MIHVFLMITAHPGKRQAMLDEILSKAETTRAEKGCVEYTVATNTATPVAMFNPTPLGEDTIAIIEKWETIEDLEAHSQQDYMPEHFANVVAMMEKRVAYFMDETA
jgi:quinol monooxygenase YgiN